MSFCANSLRQMTAHRRKKLLESLTDAEAATLLYDWPFWAREAQVAPPDKNWAHWLILAGRGFGKTRTGAEWVRTLAEGGQAERIALVAPTSADARDVMIEGESGLLSICPPWNRPVYEPSKRKLTWPNGAAATCYSADEPERLRGPQHDAAWCDELCAWRYGDAAWDMLMFGLRLGDRPRTCITTTPKPTDLLKRLMADPKVHVTHGTTYDNLDNLAVTFKDTILTKYEGTRLGRQELDAEILDSVPDALWTRDVIEAARIQLGPNGFDRLVVAVDPPITQTGDECGIVGVGSLGEKAFVVADDSAAGLSPQGWARRAVSLYHRLGADRLVAEVNQGGDMVSTILREVDPNISVRTVHASRGKLARAEPVAALYEQGRVSHVGAFPALEDQLTAFTSDFDRARMGYSPDRLDALVWAITDLMLDRAGPARIRSLV